MKRKHQFVWILIMLSFFVAPLAAAQPAEEIPGEVFFKFKQHVNDISGSIVNQNKAFKNASGAQVSPEYLKASSILDQIGLHAAILQTKVDFLDLVDRNKMQNYFSDTLNQYEKFKAEDTALLENNSAVLESVKSPAVNQFVTTAEKFYDYSGMKKVIKQVPAAVKTSPAMRVQEHQQPVMEPSAPIFSQPEMETKDF